MDYISSAARSYNITKTTNVLKTSFSKNVHIKYVISASARDYFAENISVFYYRWMFVVLLKSCFSSQGIDSRTRVLASASKSVIRLHAINGVTPAQSLMSRRLRSTLPISHRKLKPKPINHTQFHNTRS